MSISVTQSGALLRIEYDSGEMLVKDKLNTLVRVSPLDSDCVELLETTEDQTERNRYLFANYSQFSAPTGGSAIVVRDAIQALLVDVSGSGSMSLQEDYIFVGDASNIAAGVPMSGDASIVSIGTLTIASDAVTNAKAANMATKTIKGRNTAGTGDPEDLTPDGAQAVLDTATTPYIKLQSVIFNIDFSADTTAAINDATTYYIPGAQGVTMTTTAANTYGVYIENDCTLYAASFWHVSTAVASSENGTLFIRKNNTSNDNISTSVPTAGASAPIQRFTGLSINYSVGDYIYPGYTTPTYATNPTNLRIMVTLWFKLQ